MRDDQSDFSFLFCFDRVPRKKLYQARVLWLTTRQNRPTGKYRMINYPIGFEHLMGNDDHFLVVLPQTDHQAVEMGRRAAKVHRALNQMRETLATVQTVHQMLKNQPVS